MNSKYFTLAVVSIFAILSCHTKSRIKFCELSGKWINTSNDYMEIVDSVENNNFIGNNAVPIGKYFQLEGDTLSFQDRYVSSEDNFSTNRIDRYDFKVNLLTDTILSISPITERASKIFEKDTVTLTRQEYAIDKAIKFDRIIFHTTYCYGQCPIYHLEIKKDGRIKLHKEKAYVKTINNKYLVDSLNMGYYSGMISKANLKLLEHHIQTCNLDSLEFEGHLCCDGSIVTLIIYYNGKRKYLKDMFPPRIASNLINHLYRITVEEKLAKTEIKFDLEK